MRKLTLYASLLCLVLLAALSRVAIGKAVVGDSGIEDQAKEYDEYYLKVRSDKAKKIALIIGNADYAELSKLRNPINDAKDIANLLKEMKFDVTLIENAGRSSIVEAVSRFASAANNADIILFYYAGHAVQINSVNYMFGVDATQTESEFQALKSGCLILYCFRHIG